MTVCKGTARPDRDKNRELSLRFSRLLNHWAEARKVVCYTVHAPHPCRDRTLTLSCRLI